MDDPRRRVEVPNAHPHNRSADSNMTSCFCTGRLASGSTGVQVARVPGAALSATPSSPNRHAGVRTTTRGDVVDKPSRPEWPAAPLPAARRPAKCCATTPLANPSAAEQGDTRTLQQNCV
ncbi:hypothetical protein ACCO45_011368 [Purpureocillium lilacinum]|uniref:Uncharacterized protein n=1 Tax=Purpureocillium lilacinum TaxID=33203 RepID=A0ACC4DKE4_PURLI